MKKVVLLVNGSEVAMNDFVQRIILNLLSSLLSSLTLTETPHEAVFRISD